jgi:hypothetical protein
MKMKQAAGFEVSDAGEEAQSGKSMRKMKIHLRGTPISVYPPDL